MTQQDRDDDCVESEFHKIDTRLEIELEKIEMKIESQLEDKEELKIRLRTLTRLETPNKKTKRRLEIDDCEKKIKMIDYRISLLRRKQSHLRLGQMSISS